MHAYRLASLVVAVAAVTSLSACSDNIASPLDASSTRTNSELPGFPALGDFQRYVAIGTSISMGVTSDGVNAASQQMSFPAQLSRLAKREMTASIDRVPGLRGADRGAAGRWRAPER